MIQLIFWVSLVILFYTYIGYGLVISVLAFVKQKLSKQVRLTEEYYPEVTLVVPAYNEEDFIQTKLDNSLALIYPESLLKLLFITDGSTDNTFSIVRANKEVTVLHSTDRRGKSAALNRAMQFVETEIVVFNDANTLLAPDTIKKIVQKFRNPHVGGVSGEKQVVVTNDDGTSAHGEGLYWKYESFLKKKDAEVFSVMGAAGELIAFRTELVEHLEEDVILDDFMMTFSIINRGYKVDYAPDVRALETASVNVKEEMKRKIRIAAGGWQAMSRMMYLLQFWNTPLLSFMYISHRVLRWSLSAFLLPVVLMLNIVLVNQGDFFIVLLCAQGAFYAFSAIGYTQRNMPKPVKMYFIPYYFCVMNYAVLAGFLKFIKGEQSAIWERSLRTV